MAEQSGPISRRVGQQSRSINKQFCQQWQLIKQRFGQQQQLMNQQIGRQAQPFGAAAHWENAQHRPPAGDVWYRACFRPCAEDLRTLHLLLLGKFDPPGNTFS
jgi:hypothetical protein